MWYVAFREDALDEAGKIVRLRRNVRIGSAKEFSKREARRIADEEILSRVNSQAIQPGSLLTLAQFVDTSFRPEVVWALKHAGKQHYENMLKQHVIPALGNTRLRDVSCSEVQNLVRLKVEAGYSVQTALHVRNVISAVFSHAQRKRAYHGENPAKGVRLPEMQRKQSHALTFDQGKAVIAALPSPVAEMALVSMACSLNVAELLGLRWKWMNLTGAPGVVDNEVLHPYTLAVRQNYYRGHFGSPKSKSRQREVPLSATIVEALGRLRGHSSFSDPEDLVFASKTGTPLVERNLTRRYLKPVGEKLGIPWLSWHVFRHSHATFGEQTGMALSDRQAQMGHADVEMTLHYTHSDLERRRAAIETIAGKLLGPAEKGQQPAILTLDDTKPEGGGFVN